MKAWQVVILFIVLEVLEALFHLVPWMAVGEFIISHVSVVIVFAIALIIGVIVGRVHR